MTDMDNVFTIDGEFDSKADSRKKLLKDLYYIKGLAERVTQPPPKLNSDPEIEERYQRLMDFINKYGKD